MCLELKGFCAEETDHSVRLGVQNISDHPSLIPAGEKSEPLLTDNRSHDLENVSYIYEWPTWPLATALHRLPASASVADLESVFPVFIPGSEGREYRWSSSRLP